jgi:hypothetical protein
MEKSRLILFFFAIMHLSCAFNVKKITPYIVDTKTQTAREYKIVDTVPAQCGDPKYKVEYVKEHPIEDINGYVSIPADQYQEIKRYYDNYERQKQKCPTLVDDQDFN